MQVQHYLAVCGMNKAYIAALIGGNKFVFTIIYRDDSLIEELIVKENGVLGRVRTYGHRACCR